jgi:hypothetical protein
MVTLPPPLAPVFVVPLLLEPQAATDKAAATPTDTERQQRARDDMFTSEV